MIGNALILALREIRNNLMRAALTTLGIIIGVGAVIALVTLGNGATASVTDSIYSIGNNLLFLVPGTPGNGGVMVPAPAFQLADAEILRREVVNLSHVVPITQTSASVILGNKSHLTTVTGATSEYFQTRNWKIVSGRAFNVSEDRSGKSVCVIGETIRKEVFGAQDPVGQRIRLNKITCEVVGLLETKGFNTFGQDQDDYVLMPIRTVQRRLTGNNDASAIMLAVQNEAGIAKAKDEIFTIMRARRHLAANQVNNFDIRDQREFAKVLSTITGVLTLFLAAIAAVSLLVGGIGIMNVMLVSVTERTREIGIRLAIGARERDVLLQFLIEAVVLSALGGVMGIALGLAGAFAATAALKLPFIVSPSIVVIAVLFSATVGVAFGFFPARRAARLDPIEALRHE
ncbi:putative ABC transport system permease protein [Rhizomicrobium palustre]|uniref:Putative ABC transport system permease protein n=1 Tax=Rhizomicrobium palustre TaxID=189966 RepID=A0A846MV88_9PROT|nr:ABC transporter permease [Rhizomicrobium palustre]NIK87374.1 putative ABC transport system permease protein [Rhizomicrobium palustre]